MKPQTILHKALDYLFLFDVDYKFLTNDGRIYFFPNKINRELVRDLVALGLSLTEDKTGFYLLA